MTILQLILILVVMLSGWFIGKIISSKTKEELSVGRKWFKLICIVSLIAVFSSFFIFQGDELVFVTASLFFVFLIGLASLTYRKK